MVLIIVLALVAGVVSICGLVATMLEIRAHKRAYEGLMKVFFILAAVAGILIGLLS